MPARRIISLLAGRIGTVSKETKYKQFVTTYQAFLAQEQKNSFTDAASYNEFEVPNVRSLGKR
jgi:hypothetical protein